MKWFDFPQSSARMCLRLTRADSVRYRSQLQRLALLLSRRDQILSESAGGLAEAKIATFCCRSNKICSIPPSFWSSSYLSATCAASVQRAFADERCSSLVTLPFFLCDAETTSTMMDYRLLHCAVQDGPCFAQASCCQLAAIEWSFVKHFPWMSTSC